MQLHHPSPTVQKLLIAFAILVAIAVIGNPVAGIDILLVALLLLVVGHVYLQEQFLLAMLMVRPAIDYFRDWQIVTIRTPAINVNAVLAIFACGWIALMLFRHRRYLKRLPLGLLLLLLMSLMAVSAIYSVSRGTTLIETAKFINLAGLFLLSYLFVKEKIITIPLLLKTIACSAIIPIGFGIVQFAFNLGITTFDVRGRIFGTFAHPNIFAFYLLFLLFLLIQNSAISPNAFWEKHLALRRATYILLVTLLLFTYTRAALIGLIAFLLVIGILEWHRLAKILILAIALFYLIFYPLNTWLIKTYNYSLTSISLIGRVTESNEDADSFAWRLALLEESIPIIRARLLLGYGYGAFPIVWEAKRSNAHLFDDSAESHNDYLRFALELGIVGLALYAILLARLLYIIWNRCRCSPFERRQNAYLLAWVVTFIVVNVSDNMLHHTPVMWMMWSFWGAALAVPLTKCVSPNFLGKKI